MYKINFYKYFDLLNWKIIFSGIKNNIINEFCAIDYANILAEKNVLENESLLIELLILENADKNQILSLLMDKVHFDNSSEKTDIRVLRYIIFDDIFKL